MRGTVVGVLRGGPSSEHEVSLRSGHAVIMNLPPDRFTVRDIYIDKAGVWHDRGREVLPAAVLPGMDVAIIALHGAYGEDGQVQKILERYGVPYTGSDSFASFQAMHKVLAKEKAREAGLRVPRYHFVERAEDAEPIVNEVTRTFQQPVVVKPVRGGSSIGTTIEGGYHSIHQAVTGLLKNGADGVMIEELIRGIEATVGVIEDFRNEPLYVLPVVEIVPPSNAGFFSYDTKYDGSTKEICPGNFKKPITEELQRAARDIHKALGMRHYSRSDFIVSPKGIYYLETNSLPGLTTESLLPKSLGATGITYPDFLSHIIALATGTRKR